MFVLEKLTPFFENELRVLNGSREEVVYVRAELERMKVFLRIADTLEETDEEVKIWNMKARYRISYEIQGINTRIKNISEGHQRLLRKFCVPEQENTWNDRRGDALLLDKSDLVGIDEPKKKLVGRLVEGGSGRKVVSLAGMGGLGKTTLAKQVYDDSEVKKHFAIHAWIIVSRSFQMEDILKDMVQQLFQAIRKPVPKGLDGMTSDRLKTLIKYFLQERRYLIVLDDVWHINEWDAIKYALPTNNYGSRVMLTTRNADLAFSSRIESEGLVYNLEPLKQEMSWTLFCRKTFHRNSCPPHLEEICRYILKKCEGLPLAIVAIGGVLATKDKRRIDEWEMVRRSLAIAKQQNAMWPDKVRRLSIHNTLQNVQQNRPFSQLRSLFMFGVVERPYIYTQFPNGFRLLGVLDLRGAPLTRFPIYVVNLFYLKYLSLRDTKVKTIPSFIGKLQNLETLDLKHAYVTVLPAEILKLKRLRHLLVYRYEFESYAHFHSRYGFKGLEKIGALQFLQKLSLVDADQPSSGIIMQELGKLTQLRRLGIINLRTEDGAMLCLSIKNLINLRALSIMSTKEDEILDLHHLFSPPQFLQRIYFTGRLETLPNWISNLHSLVKVYLKWSRLREDPLILLQSLPNLVHLELLQVYEGETLCFRAGGFKKLKHLGLDKFDELRCIQIQVGALPSVEKLSIQRCKLLEKVPLGIEHLSKLKLLEFFDMPHEFLKTLRRDEQGEDYWRVKHIPQVYYTYWRDGGWEVYYLESFSEGETSRPNPVISSQELQTRWK
ncbi:hypothetical protein JRO89_XS01G0079000 [Xanthoceras sorbifolium]|uniref:Disease resistance protein RPM1-like n=1 Tax=Xanthoceras sorbifolium TaxID=99658 RepID=A0ABQ8IIK4_9ROSI|nr:hypothetical protein JRO89_XS01G0079000 [Xanthoceras sorbifolium]